MRFILAGYHELVYRVKVDDWNWDRVAEYNWRWMPSNNCNGSLDPGARGYIATGGHGGTPLIMLHRFIMRVTDPNLEVHHIDNDTTNALEENLLVLTQLEHAQYHRGRLW